jgi:hypothetical protein
MRALCSLTLLAGLACATPIKGHDVKDNALNREVMAVMDAYVGAMQARDADRVLSLVADDYFEDIGDSDTKNDYGRSELGAKLKERFEQTAELLMQIKLIEVVENDATLAARMRFDVRYRLNLPSGSRWERHKDVNEIVLVRVGKSLKIKSGL